MTPPPLDPRAFQAAFQLAGEASCFLDAEDTVVAANQALADLLGEALQEAGGFSEAFASQERRRVQAFLREAWRWSEAALHGVGVASSALDPVDLWANKFIGAEGERLLLVRARSARERLEAERLHEAAVLAARACNRATSVRELGASAGEVVRAALPDGSGAAWLRRTESGWSVAGAHGSLASWAGRGVFSERSLWAEFARGGESVLVADAAIELAGAAGALEVPAPTGSLVVSPILAGERAEGVLVVVADRVGAFSLVDARCLEAVGREMASASVRLQAHEAVALANEVLGLTNLELRRALRENGHLLAQLRRLNAELEDFALWTTHDLREPLRGLATLADLLSREALAAQGDVRPLAEQLAAAATRLKDHVRALHAFHEMARDAPERDGADVGDLLRDAAREAKLDGRVETVTEGRGLRVRVSRDRVVRALCDVLRYAAQQGPDAVLVEVDAPTEDEARLRFPLPFRVTARAAEVAFHVVGEPSSLALARRIVLQHGGSLAFARDEVDRLVLTLPAEAREEGANEDPPDVLPDAPGPQPRA